MRTRQKRVATDTWRSLGCRTTPLEHWSRRKATVEPRWSKQQTKKLRPKPTKINSFMTLLIAFVAFINVNSISGDIERFESLSYLRDSRWLAMNLIVSALFLFRSPSSSQYKVQDSKAFHALLCK